MKIMHKIKMDLSQHNFTPRVSVVQGDAFTRKLSIAMYANNRPWKVPEDASVIIRYRKPNGESGAYDTLPDGSSAVSVSGNCVDILVAPEALSQPGTVSLMASILYGPRQLTTFTVDLAVQAICSADETAEGTAWVAAFLPAPLEAEAEQFVVVKNVDENGRVVSLKAVDAPECDPAVIRRIAGECLEEYDFSGEIAAASMTHQWNGTVLTVTSASGTSSADLKGERGATGPAGAAGVPGADGISPIVTVTAISGGHRVKILDATGSTTFDVMNGTDGQDASVTVDSVLSDTSTNPVQNKTISAMFATWENVLTNAILPRLMPTVTAADNGKFLQVANGEWAAVTINSAEGVSF